MYRSTIIHTPLCTVVMMINLLHKICKGEKAIPLKKCHLKWAQETPKLIAIQLRYFQNIICTEKHNFLTHLFFSKVKTLRIFKWVLSNAPGKPTLRAHLNNYIHISYLLFTNTTNWNSPNKMISWVDYILGTTFITVGIIKIEFRKHFMKNVHVMNLEWLTLKWFFMCTPSQKINRI